MDSTGAGTVTVTALADQELLAKAPGALADLQFGDARTAGWSVNGPTADGLGGQRLTLTKAFTTVDQANQILGELSGPNGPLKSMKLTFERSFARSKATVSGVAQLDGGLSAFGDQPLTAALGGKPPFADRVRGDPGAGLTLTVVAHLPGRGSTTTGLVAPDGRSVSWTPDLRNGQPTSLTASFSVADSVALNARKTSTVARVMAIAWGVAAALVVVAALVAIVTGRRRRTRHRSPAH